MEYDIKFIIILSSYLNNKKKFSLKPTFDLLDEHFEEQFQEVRLHKAMNKNMSLRIMQDNYSNYFVGDTIRVSLPLNYSDNNIMYIFYFSGYPYSSSYTNADDSVQIDGILFDKYEIIETESLELKDLFFRCKILSMSKDSIWYSGDMLKVYDSLKINLKNYGRVIYPPSGQHYTH